MNIPILTIAIPVYNKEKYIKQCINSALKQKLDNIEVLVIDNCSTDSSWQIIKSFWDIETIENISWFQ